MMQEMLWPYWSLEKRSKAGRRKQKAEEEAESRKRRSEKAEEAEAIARETTVATG